MDMVGKGGGEGSRPEALTVQVPVVINQHIGVGQGE